MTMMSKRKMTRVEMMLSQDRLTEVSLEKNKIISLLMEVKLRDLRHHKQLEDKNKDKY